MSGTRSHDDREDSRPSAEELLDRYQLRDPQPLHALDGRRVSEDEDEVGEGGDGRSPQWGRLRIYLGMAAGVGKTYAMLSEGLRRKARGTDVVIGYVETHKRPLTEQQIGDLEVIPRHKVTYRGVTLEEMDVDAILARHPAVALVDELAHTNVPGSRNAKRYQDVEELRGAGIMVITTLNVQHLEGLNDIVETITGVRQRETLPDRVLDEADEIELVDIAPEALRARLRHGNVYPPERAERALQNFFSVSNLTALRELALRRTAEQTENKLEALMRGRQDEEKPVWATTATERVMVAFDARPHSSQLLREGWRLSSALKAPFLAVTVVTLAQARRSKLTTGPGPHTGPAPQTYDRALQEHKRLAEDLGAEVVVLEGDNIAAELARIARARHVTRIVIGQPSQSRWHEFLFGSVVNRLLRESTGADIQVVPERSPSPA
jgi:two-component system, OmpR family, sensor histidine kinase KdpD